MQEQRGLDATLAVLVLLVAAAIIGGGAFFMLSSRQVHEAQVSAEADLARSQAAEAEAEASARLLAEIEARQTPPNAVPSTAKVTEALADIHAVLDDWHQAAARGDGPAYFGAFTSDAVFLGTDKTERWTVQEFEAELGHHFDGVNAWTYVSTERHVSLGPLGMTAWLDERLQNEKYGEVRGSGALQRTEQGWRIAQYVMSFPVPNALAPDLVERVRGLEGPEPEDS